MTCTSPPEIADRDLLAYLDGEASAQVEQHLATCAHCRERAAALAELERRLSAELYRIECPGSEELGEYQLRLLPDERAHEIRAHVAGCRHCARELAGLQRFLADLAPEVEHRPLETAHARIQVWIARLAEGLAGSGPLLQPAPALGGLRGSGEGPQVYEAGDLQLSIEVETDPHRPGRRTLLGLLVGASSGSFQAGLWQEGRRVASAPVEEVGSFVIPGVEVGSYDLVLSAPDVEVHVQGLEVA